VDPDSRRVSVTVTDGRGRRIADGGLARWLGAIVPVRLQGDVAIALVTNAHIRRLNRQYRGKDYATDVLSFPPDPAPRTVPPRTATLRQAQGRPEHRRGADDGRQPFDKLRAASSEVEGRLLGDIVVATGAAKRQAREVGHSYQTELRVLALHGFLHLLGYDHDDPDDHGRMARAEARLRRRGGLPAGLIARAEQRPTRKTR
jgi:probable rRNA maturation factor